VGGLGKYGQKPLGGFPDVCPWEQPSAGSEPARPRATLPSAAGEGGRGAHAAAPANRLTRPSDGHAGAAVLPTPSLRPPPGEAALPPSFRGHGLASGGNHTHGPLRSSRKRRRRSRRRRSRRRKAETPSHAPPQPPVPRVTPPRRAASRTCAARQPRPPRAWPRPRAHAQSLVRRCQGETTGRLPRVGSFL